MFFNSKDFKVLEAGVQTTWMRYQLHTQNLANLETPGYKSKSLSFEEILSNAKTAEELPDAIHVSVVSNEASSLRPDGNNVDFEKENIELFKAYSQYSLLLDKVKGKFDQVGYVLNSNMK